jgi:poly(A)-specific ribonuclease
LDSTVIRRIEEPGAKGYDISDEKQHEAGFDAFITGVCFIGMAQFLGTLQHPPKPRVLPESPLVMPFLNK